jgi:putative tryptophan/tyrosine transport system substrate-binding protein
MKRREFITLLGGAAAAWPVTAHGQQAGKVYRLGFIGNDPTIPTTAAGAAFVQGLRENGFVEGKNIAIQWRFAEGRGDRPAALISELVRDNIDVLVTSGAQNHVAAKRSTTKIPIVMVNAIDPVGEGLVASLARPGGNITGLVQVPSAELAGKRIQLLKDVAPQISRVAVLINPDFASDYSQLTVLEHAAQSLKVTLFAVSARRGQRTRRCTRQVDRRTPGCALRDEQWSQPDLPERHHRVCGRASSAVNALIHRGDAGWRPHLLCYGPTRLIPTRRVASGKDSQGS